MKSGETKSAAATVPAEQHSSPRRPGPVPGVPTRKYNVLIEEPLAEWAKGQPGGLSEMVRRLLKEERVRRAAD